MGEVQTAPHGWFRGPVDEWGVTCRKAGTLQFAESSRPPGSPTKKRAAQRKALGRVGDVRQPG